MSAMKEDYRKRAIAHIINAYTMGFEGFDSYRFASLIDAFINTSLQTETNPTKRDSLTTVSESLFNQRLIFSKLSAWRSKLVRGGKHRLKGATYRFKSHGLNHFAQPHVLYTHKNGKPARYDYCVHAFNSVQTGISLSARQIQHWLTALPEGERFQIPVGWTYANNGGHHSAFVFEKKNDKLFFYYVDVGGGKELNYTYENMVLIRRYEVPEDAITDESFRVGLTRLLQLGTFHVESIDQALSVIQHTIKHLFKGKECLSNWITSEQDHGYCSRDTLFRDLTREVGQSHFEEDIQLPLLEETRAYIDSRLKNYERPFHKLTKKRKRDYADYKKIGRAHV